MKILIGGSSGTIGQALVPFLRNEGHEVIRLVRRPASAGEVSWDPAQKILDPNSLQGIEVIINLSGENIGSSRWTAKKKEKILQSRIDATQTLCDAVKTMEVPPKIFMSGSAIGFYDQETQAEVDESSPKGNGFLSDVCQKWEKPLEEIHYRGVRAVILRTGIVLTPKGGALAQMLTPFKWGLGGVIGSGKQFMSWIAIEDLVAAYQHILTHDHLEGPINLVAPNPVTNREFTQALGKALKRPTFFTIPAWVAQLAFGEMADEMLLKGAKVVPHKLQQSGFIFTYPEINTYFNHSLS